MFFGAYLLRTIVIVAIFFFKKSFTKKVNFVPYRLRFAIDFIKYKEF